MGRLVPLALAVGVATALAVVRPAHAQDLTTGAIAGVVTDELTGEPAAGVTIVITSPRTRAETTFTDVDGTFKVTGLLPGDGYLVTFYYGDLTVERAGLRVSVNRTVTIAIALTPEVIYVTGDAPDVDRHSTTHGRRIGRDELTKVPVPGTSFDESIGSTPGTAGDGYGIAASGSTSLENQWVVDGVSTTGLSYGTSGMQVLNDFIEEIEVITGGYNAEYGRATGAVINAVTRSGTNELAGSVVAYVTPGALVAARARTPSQATSIEATADTGLELELGFELGGPIVKDRAWFWIGVAPKVERTAITRITQRRTDCRMTLDDGTLSTPADQACPDDVPAALQDGVADVDPATGFRIYEELDRSEHVQQQTRVGVMGKINVAVSPAHQGQVSITAQPSRFRGARMAGAVAEQRLAQDQQVMSGALKWTSKLNDDRTEIESVVSLFRTSSRFGSDGGGRDDLPLQTLYYGSLGTWAGLGESRRTADGCRDDDGGDPYRLIRNCPDEGAGYSIGGPGPLVDDVERRLGAKLGVVHRVRALGNHELKAGGDVDQGRISHLRAYSGGALVQNELGGSISHWRWVELAPRGAADADYPDRCVDPAAELDARCLVLDRHDDAARVEGETLSWSAYLRDSWQLRPHLTINAGLRYEEQRLRHAAHLRGTVDDRTGERRGTDAMVLDGMWSPRLGAIYDWTKEARGKVYGHWGRFYESVPMDINDRAFGGEVTSIVRYDPAQCGDVVDAIGGPDGTRCPGDEAPADGSQLLGGSTLIAPDIRAQYMDELVVGAEYELIEDLKLGVSYQSRRLGRVIEDVSVDGAQTYVIANPGEWSAEAEAELAAQVEALPDGSDERRELQRSLDQYRAIRAFDRPRRDYDALQLTASRRLSRGLFVQASYTWSRAVGNYPGLISYDNGQVDPNISSQYDLIELLANREGPLPQDRPHYVKLDGYYTHDLRKAGALTFGLRARALSGTPVDVLASHPLYGLNESLVLPRGSLRRTDFETSLDVHVEYARVLGRGVTLMVFGDVYNVANDQGAFSVDEAYSYASNINPIVGGSYEDLVWAKAVDDRGNADGSPVVRNPNFGQVAGRYAPLSARVGARLTF